MSLNQAGHLGVEILNAARRWAAARNKCRRLYDSKSAAKAEVEAATKIYNKASDELETAVRRLESLMRTTGMMVPMRRKGAPFPWKPFLGALSAGLNALENAVNTKPNVIDAEVIDVTPPGD